MCHGGEPIPVPIISAPVNTSLGTYNKPTTTTLRRATGLYVPNNLHILIP